MSKIINTERKCDFCNKVIGTFKKRWIVKYLDEQEDFEDMCYECYQKVKQ